MEKEELEKLYAPLLAKCEYGLDEVPAGWLGVVEEMLEEMACMVPRPELHQIKSKYAQLTVYGMHVSPAKLAHWEALADRTCEVCGDAGDRTVHRGWHRIECYDCKCDREMEQHPWAI